MARPGDRGLAHTLPVALDNAVWAAGGGFGAGTSAADGALFRRGGRTSPHPARRKARTAWS